MKDIVEPNQHKLAAKLLREIADRQPFHVEIYHEAFPFADQYLIILPSMYRNVGKLCDSDKSNLFQIPQRY